MDIDVFVRSYNLPPVKIIFNLWNVMY